ncbi:50S ribosomal protein L19 [Candidatus Parcubacteria bacterium]|nr:50S ribosomal protein L19 [Candidatus Parcubacteria bacterium]
MTTKIEAFIKPYLKKDLPDIRPGDLVKVYQKIKEGDKERVQAFEGRVIARKHGKGISATITVRRITGGIGVEKIFPLHLSTIEKIEILERGKVRRAKLYYLRGVKKKKTRLKRKEFVQPEVKEQAKEKPKDEKKEVVEKEEIKEEKQEIKKIKKEENKDKE